MHSQLAARCPNRQCARANRSPAATTAFCSHQCAYLYTLRTLRESASASPRRGARQAASSVQRAQPLLPGKSHTFLLVRCGIDPWAPADEIQMRQHSCHMLIIVLGRYMQSRNVADFAWPLENMSYCLSHLPEYASRWGAVAEAKSAAQRYHLLCSALMRLVATDAPYVHALLSGHIHPAEFYKSVFAQ
ncbi:hypothetical protein IWQ56_000477 [Coemansia nantahalensis]|uniref:Uncharacterized protein n=2 Tax=Coemansia TaxID=4863 RepID=A0ACC1L2Q0_9FUNG|nr:hypothetical protein IWQ57_003442 [Coemansia nantahalensis]KAJ2774687.1 hypothetical protein IWQ56_000477 [Coemansia nantahalensis]KAJ2799236.1 hypothetical protein H4R21_003618 [Coemansia helicoidea]